jgi:hypothetical protein
MPKRLMLILCLLFGLALACSRSAGEDQQQAATQAAPQAPPAETTPGQEVFLPDVDSGAGGQTDQAGQAPQATTAPNTVYLPDIGADAVQIPAPVIQIQAGSPALKVGETLTLAASLSGVGMPYFDLAVLDQGAAQSQVLVQVTFENVVNPRPGASAVLELVSAEGRMDQATFVLRAKAAGTAEVTVYASGEVQVDQGVFAWGGAGSDPLQVTVSP